MKRMGLLIVAAAIGLTLPGAGLLPNALAQSAGLEGLELIQAVPERITRFFAAADARRILDGLTRVALVQWDLEGFAETVANPDTGEEVTVRGGTFGHLIRQELLAADLSEGMLVEHVRLIQTPGLTPEFDEDIYRLSDGDLEIDLELNRLEGRPLKGLDWGIRRLESRQFIAEEHSGRLRVLELSIVNNVAVFTERFFAPNGRFLEGTLWEFEPGNPDPVEQRPLR